MKIKLNEHLDDYTLTQLWQKIDWKAAAFELLRMQRLIALAAIKNDFISVAQTQLSLINSPEAKVLAVRQICDAVAQPGIDNEIWDTDVKKIRAAIALKSTNYVASAMRMLVIKPKGSEKKRFIQIPTYYDRALQTLWAWALDPVAESIGERKSFAFRKGRSMFDVHAFIIKAIENNGDQPPAYLVKADVKACYNFTGKPQALPGDSQSLTITGI